jgi:Fur family ferric uptake transcriptional regulator
MEWQARLSKAGYRISRPRGLIMAILEKAGLPLSPLDIFNQAKQEGHLLSVASIYRTLEVLTELDLIKLVHTHSNCNGFVRASIGHKHYVICSGCERIMEFDGMDDISELIDRVQGDTGFLIQKHLLQLFGLCPECQRRS